MKKVPIVFFVFNRPEQTRRVIRRILEYSPERLYIYADGPRNLEEKNLTDEVRRVIGEEVKKNKNKLQLIKKYARNNNGLTHNITAGLNEVFKREDSAIILEDDCLPNASFFIFSEILLTKYKNTNSIMSISGHSHGHKTKYSYIFSSYPQCWGWSTWSRAWKKYDVNLTRNVPIETLLKNFDNFFERIFWREIINLINRQKILTWDYQWTLAHIIHKGLAVTPTVNLVENIGFGENATNTQYALPQHLIKAQSISFPLRHPTSTKKNVSVDRKIRSRSYLSVIPILGLIKRKLSRA